MLYVDDGSNEPECTIAMLREKQTPLNKTPMMPHKCPKGIRAGINIVKTALCITECKGNNYYSLYRKKSNNFYNSFNPCNRI